MLYKTMYYCTLQANEVIHLKKESFNIEDREIYHIKFVRGLNFVCYDYYLKIKFIKKNCSTRFFK